jgi:hypothetical protein
MSRRTFLSRDESRWAGILGNYEGHVATPEPHALSSRGADLTGIAAFLKRARRQLQELRFLVCSRRNSLSNSSNAMEVLIALWNGKRHSDVDLNRGGAICVP